MNAHRLALSIAAACLFLPLTAGAETLRLATWNMEWLMLPGTFDQLAARCTEQGAKKARGSDRSIPCDLIPARRWDDASLARLAEYARSIDYDVVALQETDGPEAAKRVFPTHNLCFTRRRNVQNVGFAIRQGIPFRCNADYRALGLKKDTVRWGADVTLYPGTPQAIRLLAVHLKSSCNRDPLTTDSDACRTLSKQVPVLEQWIDARAREGARFAVLGDFNRRFDRETAPARDEAGRIVALWPEIDDADPPGADLSEPGADVGPTACRPGERTRSRIDHIVLGRSLADAYVPGSFRHEQYPGTAQERWPDHCPVGITLNLAYQ